MHHLHNSIIHRAKKNAVLHSSPVLRYHTYISSGILPPESPLASVATATSRAEGQPSAKCLHLVG